MTGDGETGRTRRGDRETVAAYLRQIAAGIESGEPLPVGEGAPTATSPVTVGVRSRKDGDETRVRIDLSWDSETASGGDEAERGRAAQRGADVGTASGGGSGGPEPAGDETSPDLDLPEDDLPAPSVGTRNAERAAHELDRAVTFAAKGKTRAADSRYRQAIEADPADATIRRQYANFLLEVDESARALTQFERALEIAPEDAGLHVARANANWRRGETAAATDAFERALELAPEDPDVLSTYGRFCWEEREDVEAAVEHLREALAVDDEHALAHLNFAVLLRHGGHDERAATHYERAIDLGADNATVQAEYGHYLWASGDVEEAARHYAKARELGAEL